MHPIHSHSRRRGYTLVELLLVAGVVSAGMAAVYGFYQFTTSQQRTSERIGDTAAIVERITQSFAAESDYRYLSTERAVAEGLLGDVEVVQGQPIGPWGGAIRLAPATVQRAGQTFEQGGFILTFEDFPADLCLGLGQAIGSQADQVLIQEQALGDRTDPAQLAAACQPGPVEMGLVFAKPSLASAPLALCTPPNEPQRQRVPCPAGTTGEMEQERTGACLSPYGDVAWAPWTTVYSNCQTCPTAPQTREGRCEVGEYGARQQRRVFDCAARAWSEWETISENCLPCPQEPEVKSEACPGGMTGERIFERVFFCTRGEWGPWLLKSVECDTHAPYPVRSQ